MTDINQFIKDTTTASFSEDVIEASSHSLFGRHGVDPVSN